MNKKTIIIGLISMFVMLASNVSAKKSITNEESMPKQEMIYDVVEVMPSYPGGTTKLMEFLNNNVMYPKIAQKKGIQGRVVVKFIVEKNGMVTNVETLRQVNPELDNEAIRVVKSMPKWTPGMHNGKAVRVKYCLPISFRLK